MNQTEHLLMEQGIKNKTLDLNLIKTNFRISSVQILGLDSDTSYNIEVYSEQISTHLLSKSVDLSFTTKRPSINFETIRKK